MDSYQPDGIYFDLGKHSVSRETKVHPSEIVSSKQLIPVSYSSYPYGKSSPTIIGNTAYMKSGGNRLEAFAKSDFDMNGLATHWEDKGPRFQSWKDAGEKPQTREYVRIPKITESSGMRESFASRKLKLTNKDTPVDLYVHDVYVNWPNNRAGQGFHHIENLRQHLTSYLGTEDGKELPATLTEVGGKPAYIDYLGVGFLPKTAIYGVTRTKDGKILLTAAPDAFEKIASDAKYLDIGLYDLMDKAIAEEISHIWFRDFDKHGDSISIEIAAKEDVLRHYLRLKEKAEGDPKKLELKRRREKQIEVTERDIATTPQRYRKSGLESLIAAWEEEAANLGVDKTEYVSNKLATKAYVEEEKITESYNTKSGATHEKNVTSKYKSMRNIEKADVKQYKGTRQTEKAVAEESSESPAEESAEAA